MKGFITVLWIKAIASFFIATSIFENAKSAIQEIEGCIFALIFVLCICTAFILTGLDKILKNQLQGKQI